jgi:pimeloyl-ACP methyl ester carboxylesterase
VGVISYRQPGTVVVEHLFHVPLRHAEPAGEQIEVFAREIVADEAGAVDRPVLLFLQGGPGGSSPRPVGAESWLRQALPHYRVLLLDQRGTGRSTPADRRTLGSRGGAEAQAEYLRHFRADAIVADCELIRHRLIGDGRFSVLGQSFGGFCAMTYLSFANEGLREVLITGGLPGLEATADDVYRLTYPTVIARSRAHYERYPQDIAAVAAIVARLGDAPERLPAGGTLTVEAFQSLGMMLGAGTGSHRLHYLLESAQPSASGFSDTFLADVEAELSFIRRPLYAVVHEACYAQGVATRWAAERIRGEFPVVDARASLERGDPVMFTGEMIYPWMFDTDPALHPLREVADILAEVTDWPTLYDPTQLASNAVTTRAAVYFDDMYVDRTLSLRTAAAVPNLQPWVTNEYEHDGLRTSDGKVLGHLLGMTVG